MNEDPKETNVERDIKELVNKFLQKSSEEEKNQYNQILANVMKQITSTEYKGIDKIMRMIAPEIIIAKLTRESKLVEEQRAGLAEWQRSQIDNRLLWQQVKRVSEFEGIIDDAIKDVKGDRFTFPQASRGRKR